MRRFILSTLVASTLVAIAATTSGTAALGTAAHAAPVKARSAEDVVESIGVNLHLGYDDRVYNEFPKVKAGLLDLGIRHYRDALENPAFKQFVKDRHNELGRAGLRGTFLSSAAPAQDLAAAELVAESLEAFEGQNEVLNIYVHWDDAKRDAARQHQRDLYKAVKDSPKWRGFPVIGPSAVGYEGYRALGDLSAFMDLGNAHAYPLGPAPAVPESGYFKEMEGAALVAAGKAIVVTETGYQTGQNKEGNQRVSLFLENFNRGIVRSFWYELINQGTDQSQESNFGLLNKDFSLKPSGLAVKNLIALLGESSYNVTTRQWESPNPAFKPGALDFTLSGDVASVHSTLLQKTNGRFYLCLWQEVASYNHDDKVEADIVVPAVKVSLNLAAPIASAALYSPTRDAKASPLAVAGNRIALNVPDEVVIVEVTPRATAKRR